MKKREASIVVKTGKEERREELLAIRFTLKVKYQNRILRME